MGQFVFQHAAKTSDGLWGLLGNPWAWFGMVCYVTVMVMFTQAFRLGGTVKVLYPVYASTFIFAALMAWAFCSDPVRPLHAAGMLLLMAGIICMSW